MDFCHKVMMLPFNTLSRFVMGFPSGSDGKESAYRCKKTQVRSLGWEDPWRREWQLTPVFLPGEFHGQRSLACYSPWGCKELDMIEQLTLIQMADSCWYLALPLVLKTVFSTCKILISNEWTQKRTQIKTGSTMVPPWFIKCWHATIFASHFFSFMKKN